MALKKQQFSDDEIAIFDDAMIYRRGEYWHFRMWLNGEGKYARNVKRRRRLTPDRLAILTPDDDELIRPGEAGRGCATGSDQRDGVQARFLKRQLSLPVSTMSQWWVSRSRSAVVIFASPKTEGHSPKARLVVTMTEVCS